MIAKSKTKEEHLINLKKLFQRLRKFKLKLNLTKCTFGLRSRKLLGFVEPKRDRSRPRQGKCNPGHATPLYGKEVWGFLGRLNYIAWFISQLTSTCERIFKLLHNNQTIKWNEDCQITFYKIKQYLREPPMRPQITGKPFILYLTMLKESMGCVLGQHDEIY